MASADLLRSVELISSFMDAPRSLVSALSTECLNCAMVSAISSLRCACAWLASAWMAASFSRSIMVSRNTITARAISPISSRASVAGMRALVSPSASCFITPDRPLSGRVMLRPISQLKPRPNATMAMPTAIIPVRVWACDAVRADDASSAVSVARSMMSSARGSMFWLSISITARSGCTRS